MNFMQLKFLLPISVLMIVFVLFTYVFEKNYFRWIKSHWFMKRTMTSHIATLLQMTGFIFLSVIILDPRGKEIKVEAPVKKSKTIILIDTSTSMLVEDVRPNRLERATLLAKHFARRASGHHISIMVFADITKKLVPFTNDRDLIDARIDSIKEIRNLNAGTSVEKAIAEASRSFNIKDKQVSGNILVITDGEDHGEKINIEVSENIKIAFLGVGTTEGGSIPLKDARGMFYGYKKDRAITVISKLDRRYFLDAVDNKPNRKYFEASLTNIPSDEIYDFFSSSSFGSENEETSIRPVALETYAYPGIILILVSLLMRFLPQLTTLIVVFTLNAYSSTEMPVEISKKLELLKKGELNKEEKINLADNLIKYKMRQAAREIYEENLSQDDIQANPQSHFNWATSLLEDGEYQQALDKFQKLEEKISDENTKKLVRDNIKAAFQQQDQKDKQKDKNKDKQESKDKQQENKDQSSDENESNDNSNEGSSGESKGEGSSSGNDKKDNNPYDLDDENESDKSENEKEKGKDNQKSDEGNKEEQKKTEVAESEQGKGKKPVGPLLEQLKQDDRKLQIKLLDTSTQGGNQPKKKDW